MKKKEISLILLNNTGSTIKKISASDKAVRSACFFLVLFVIVMGYLVHDYISLKRASLDNVYLQDKVSVQEDELVNQRKQIQFFANEIKTIKSKLTDLHNFEKKIRAMAKIKKNKRFIGIGGSNPDTIDTAIALTERHDSLMQEMHVQVAEIDFAASRQKEGLKSVVSFFEEQRNLLAVSPSIRPTFGNITSTFGYRTSPFTGLREFHKGIDIAAPGGTPIIATANGVVSEAGYLGSLGNAIVINHGYGMVTCYGHASKILKKPGSFVKRGEIIARVGNTGRSTGAHVHYEIHHNGIPVNPSNYLLN
ncbi:MAG: M23 family metallopeptidase [Proteobacteria bacterium]|nr:M23 family metallopeptidase [Pseudomonadota bacterium]MBU4009249.1 M23 family metallopeptidase [Pseudomonadota bacterium]